MSISASVEDCKVAARPVSIDVQGGMMSARFFPSPPDVLATEHRPKRIVGRGKIQGFSRPSARRFRNLSERLDWEWYCERDAAWFVTLTIPEGHECNLPDVQRRFNKSLSRAFGDGCSYVFVKERMRNGMPHYHGFLLGVPIGDSRLRFLYVTSKVRGLWARALAWDGPCQLQVRFDRVRDPRNGVRYAVKYASKGMEGAQRTADTSADTPAASSILDSVAYRAVGKWWGVLNRSSLRFAPRVKWVGRVDEAAFQKFKRGFRRFLESEQRQYVRFLKGQGCPRPVAVARARTGRFISYLRRRDAYFFTIYKDRNSSAFYRLFDWSVETS